jgi:hypothetical protein
MATVPVWSDIDIKTHFCFYGSNEDTYVHYNMKERCQSTG